MSSAMWDLAHIGEQKKKKHKNQRQTKTLFSWSLQLFKVELEFQENVPDLSVGGEPLLCNPLDPVCPVPGRQPSLWHERPWMDLGELPSLT